MHEPNKVDLPALMSAWREKMLTDFNRLTAQLPHAGAKGEAREQTLIKFLRDYLPGRFGVESGFVVTSDGTVSRQTDVVVYDQHITPVFRNLGNQHFFPVESVLATIEVKSRLTPEELKGALKKAQEIKAFKRSGPNILGGFLLDSGDGPPPAAFIFAFDSSELSTLSDALYEHNRTIASARQQWVNLICSLTKGIITYCDEKDSLNISSTERAKKISFTIPSEAGNSLAIFYSHLVHHLIGTPAIRPKIFSYAGLAKTLTKDRIIDY